MPLGDYFSRLRTHRFGLYVRHCPYIFSIIIWGARRFGAPVLAIHNPQHSYLGPNDWPNSFVLALRGGNQEASGERVLGASARS